MELRHLRYFVAVAEEQNVTRAAARLHVSQPPLTRQIHDLEEELGVELFERTGKSIRLTEPGRVFLKAARECLQRVDDAVAAVRTAASKGGGELHVGYAPSPTVELLPRILREFRKKAPKVRIILHDHTSSEMLAGLRTGRLQAAFMVKPSAAAGKGVTFQKLQSFPIAVGVALDHPFATRRSVKIADVLKEPLVGYSRKEYPDYHELLQTIVGPRAKRLRFAEECDSGPSLVAAVESGKGVCISAALHAAVGGRLRFVPMIPRPDAIVVGIAYRPKAMSPALTALAETAKVFCERL